MLQWYVLSLFLYFPEDKTEYIPAVIWLAVFMVFAFLAMRWFVRVSKREGEKTKELEERINQQMKNQK
ncbi:hypothetical protein [Cytobacillus purgationiresistens]|uniref:Flagellar biosynthesis/type III secretory pathway M-ring protein FliF/YscJ n=1 Tax=Cytobacillus purgationiresistens TaxID=863449 RepID=A0ABU0AI14_9BACI|nr:hypothetical protein [Cytobacillus purgationiresistens]MDQ0270893.1 flagellar biosynthesis/type III secretory pathway M-ring protein FliF/YscJ [Cytobacillus purgationiresistens]